MLTHFKPFDAHVGLGLTNMGCQMHIHYPHNWLIQLKKARKRKESRKKEKKSMSW